MSISGYFTDFSFPELLRFIHGARKTGRLQVKPLDTHEHQSYHFWFRGGNVVTVQHPRLSLQVLLPQFCQRAAEALKVYLDRTPAYREPIGTVLKQLQLIQPEELQAIFSRQVIQPMLYQFTLDNAWFKFEPNYELPYEEMTGLSLSPIEAALNGLRRLRNWEPLKTKLPESTSSLMRTSKSFAPYQLTDDEIRVWSLADEEHSLEEIAQRLELSLQEVQKIAFRLMIAGLVDECPGVQVQTAESVQTIEEKDVMSSSFLSNLLGFLKQRA
jgi:hypothetical protein